MKRALAAPGVSASLAAVLAAAMVLAQVPAAAQGAGPESAEFPVPAFAGAYQPQNSDERGLWAEDDERERTLRDSDAVIRDPALNEYVRGVLCRAVGEDRCGAVRIYIVRAPVFNASMSPNGTMRVFTGLLLRVRSESELASVLGHEFAHFELRHSLAGYRARRSGSDLAAWIGVASLGALALGTGTGYSGGSMRVAVYGDLYRFQREQESTADRLGFGYMTGSGYRPSAAADVWRAVMDETDQTALDRGRRSQRYDNVAFFASHPTHLERANTLDTLAASAGGGDYDGREQHLAALAPHLAMFLADELALNDFGGTDFVIQRMAGDDYSAPLLFARGELYRKRGHPRDLASATGFYQEALALDPANVEAWRGLGLAQMRSGNAIEGANALRTYLERAPDVADAPMLRMMIGDQ